MGASDAGLLSPYGTATATVALVWNERPPPGGACRKGIGAHAV